LVAEAEVDIGPGASPMDECRQLGLAQLRKALLHTGLITEVECGNGVACLSDSGHWLIDPTSIAAREQKLSGLIPSPP
jgi:hypothetical protein